MINQISSAPSQRTSAGFTLLELMIALSIFSVMGLAAYRLLSGETHLQSELQQHSQELQQWQRGMRRLTSDLQQIAPRPVRLEYGDTEGALIGNSDSLHFTRSGWSNPLHKTRSQLQRIELRLASSEDTDTRFLQRLSWPVLDRAPDSEALSQHLLPKISDIRWRYMDDKKQWHNQWPASYSTGDASETKDALPLAIEVTLQSEQFGEISRLVVLRAFAEDKT